MFVVYTVSEKERSSLTTTFKGDTPNTEEKKNEKKETHNNHDTTVYIHFI